jgi:uncharacterized membrane protein
MFLEYGNLFYIYSIGLTLVVLLSCATYHVSNKFSIKVNKKNSYYIFCFSFLFYTVSIFYLSFNKINALHHNVDFATVLEILWQNYEGFGLRTFMSEYYHGGSHWFAAHFTPIIYLTYVPVFAVYQSQYVIPISETFFILSSLIPLWLISKKYIDDDLSRLFISSFLFYPTIFYTNLRGVAFIELSIPLFFWLFYFYEEKKNKLFILTLILCLMVRVEVSLITCFFGIYMLIRKRYSLASFTIILSIAYFYIVLFVVMPSYRVENFGQDHIVAHFFKELGNTYSEIILNILFNPIDSLSKIFTLPKIVNLFMFLIPLLLLPIINLSVFLIAIPNLAIVFLSSVISHSSFILYYLSPSIPIFFYAAITGFSKLKNYKFINVNSLVNAILVASMSSTVFFGGTVISIAFWNKNYVVGNFYTTSFHRSAYVQDDRDIIAKEIIKLIPQDASVSAEGHFLPLLYKNKRMTIFPEEHDSMEYVLIDKFHPKKTGYMDSYLKFRYDPDFYYQKYLKSKYWEVIAEDKGVTLLKKKKF